jgi:DNA-binding transcriptional ArsR family regulator
MGKQGGELTNNNGSAEYSNNYCLTKKSRQYKNSNMKSILNDKSIFEMQAEICKTLTNPKRIEILNTLKNDEKTVTELVAALGASKANVSQHLAVMRHKGILATRREGVNIYYRVSNPKVIEACSLMKEVLFEQHAARKKTVTGVAG